MANAGATVIKVFSIGFFFDAYPFPTFCMLFRLWVMKLTNELIIITIIYK